MKYAQTAALVLAACGGEEGATLDGGREREVVVEVAGQPTGVLYQDGDGAWQVAARLDDQRYGFDLEGERYGVAAFCAGADGVRGRVLYATTRDLVEPTLATDCTPAAAVAQATVTGELSGLAGARGISVQSRAFGITQPVELVHSPVVPYQVSAEAGPQTLVFARLGFGGLPDMFAIRRDVAIAGALAIDVAFDRDGVFAEQLTFSGDSGDGAPSTVEARFVAGGTAIALGNPQLNFGTVARPPAELWRAGDRLELVSTTDGLEPGDFRRAIVTAYAYDEVVDVVELPRAMTGATLGFEAGDPVLLWSDYTGVERWTATVFHPVVGAPVWDLSVTRSWLSPTASSKRAPIPGERALAPLGLWDERLRIVAGSTWRLDGALARGRWQATVGRTGTVR